MTNTVISIEAKKLAKEITDWLSSNKRTALSDMEWQIKVQKAMTESNQKSYKKGLEDAANFVWNCHLGGIGIKEITQAIKAMT